MKRKPRKVKRREYRLALTEREKQILRLMVKGLSDYKIAQKLGIEAPTVTRSRLNALKKIKQADADLEFFNSLILKVAV
jgi:DNA-binding NarL/FixJ family response regulator